MLRIVTPALLGALLLTGCPRDLTLPEPIEVKPPRIVDFWPRAGFAGDRITVWGENLDVVGNQLIFPGGATVQADTAEGGLKDVITVRPFADGGVSPRGPYGSVTFTVPSGLFTTGRLVLANTGGRSELSGADFTPLGNGFPNLGTPVAQLRFRHDPVGVVDTAANVFMASSIFDLLVTDGRSEYVAPGKPVAVRAHPRVADGSRSLVSVSTAEGGRLIEVDTGSGEEVGGSAASDFLEHFILPPGDASSAARTVGVDGQGHWFLATWTQSGTTYSATRLPLLLTGVNVSSVLGATALGPLTVLVVRLTALATPTVLSVGPGGVIRAEWNPRDTPQSACDASPALCELPDGPIALVPMPATTLPDGGTGPTPAPVTAVSVESGDLVLLRDLKLQTDGITPPTAEELTLISYAPLEALAASTAPGKVVFTKAVDGALFQYDLLAGGADWAVQLRGEPSVIDVAPGIDEIAVGNHADNAVDIVRASTGTWLGRVAFNLGLGSAGRGPGGIVAPYSYDPAVLAGLGERPQRMDLLMRNVGLVASVNASSLEIMGAVPLTLTGLYGAPLRLAVTHDLQTLVLHEKGLGLLVDKPDGTRVELRIAEAEAGQTWSDLVVLPGGEVVVAALDLVTNTNVVRSYAWEGQKLKAYGGLSLGRSDTLLALGAAGDEVLVFYVTDDGTPRPNPPATSLFHGGFYRPRDFANARPVPTKELTFNSLLDGFVGLSQLREGPALLFSSQGSAGPRALLVEDLREDGPGVTSIVNGPTVAGASPNGRYVVWLDQGGAEPMARLVNAESRTDGLTGYSTYRLPGPAAGPAFDPSGEWFYLPVPLLDELEVVQ